VDLSQGELIPSCLPTTAVLFREYQNPLHCSKNSNIPTIIYISDRKRKWRKLKEKGKEVENRKEMRGSKGEEGRKEENEGGRSW